MSSDGLAGILVTAQKRKEKIKDVPTNSMLVN
jgi:hypothetical protein